MTPWFRFEIKLKYLFNRTIWKSYNADYNLKSGKQDICHLFFCLQAQILTHISCHSIDRIIVIDNWKWTVGKKINIHIRLFPSHSFRISEFEYNLKQFGEKRLKFREKQPCWKIMPIGSTLWSHFRSRYL